MEDKMIIPSSLKNHAYKLSKTVMIASLLGACFVIIYFILVYIIGVGRDLKGLIALISMFASMLLVYLITPILSLIVVSDIFCNWRAIVYLDDSEKNKNLISKIAYTYLIASILFIFSAVSLLPGVLEFFVGSVRARSLPALMIFWLLTMALLALAMGFISYRLFVKTSRSILLRFGAFFVILAGFIAGIQILGIINYRYYITQRLEYSHKSQTYSGNSESLQRTVIVPTLDSPCPKNKNVIWCSSFQLAWNRMKDDVIGAPIDVADADDVASRLNSAKQSDSDLETRSFYAAAGRIKDGIVRKIRKEMAAKFPSHQLLDLNITDEPNGIVSYSYLFANVPFRHPYRQVRDKFVFTDSSGLKTNVGAFGVWGIQWKYREIREQVEIFFHYEDYKESNPNRRTREFAVDLCRFSEPYQVIAAVVEPKETLAETLEYIQNKIADESKDSQNEDIDLLDRVDILKVPEMFWEIDHRFDELIGKMVANANPPMPIIEAKQYIKFRLDRYGAMLKSEAAFVVAAIPRRFIFNRPFLVYMKMREREQPFFVMWVDNAELLNRQ